MINLKKGLIGVTAISLSSFLCLSVQAYEVQNANAKTYNVALANNSSAASRKAQRVESLHDQIQAILNNKPRNIIAGTAFRVTTPSQKLYLKKAKPIVNKAR